MRMREDKRRTAFHRGVVQNKVVQGWADGPVQRMQWHTLYMIDEFSARLGSREILLDAPRQLPNSESSWMSHFHAQTVKNRSSCSSSACWLSVLRIDVKDPWVSCR